MSQVTSFKWLVSSVTTQKTKRMKRGWGEEERKGNQSTLPRDAQDSTSVVGGIYIGYEEPRAVQTQGAIHSRLREKRKKRDGVVLGKGN